jgi:sec-independent protein translocase protein TatB
VSPVGLSYFFLHLCPSLPLFHFRQYDERMSFSETIFLFFLALIVFGPKKLPEIARQIGKALNEFRRASNEFKAQIEHEISNLEVEKNAEKKTASAHATFAAASPAPEGTAARTSYPAASGSAEQSPAETSSADASVASNSAETSSAPASSTDSPATLAVPTEPPAEARAAEPASEALRSPEAVTSSTSQESHA